MGSQLSRVIIHWGLRSLAFSIPAVLYVHFNLLPSVQKRENYRPETSVFWYHYIQPLLFNTFFITAGALQADFMAQTKKFRLFSLHFLFSLESPFLNNTQRLVKSLQQAGFMANQTKGSRLYPPYFLVSFESSISTHRSLRAVYICIVLLAFVYSRTKNARTLFYWNTTKDGFFTKFFALPASSFLFYSILHKRDFLSFFLLPIFAISTLWATFPAFLSSFPRSLLSLENIESIRENLLD